MKEKRATVQDLNTPYADLEKEELQGRVENSPGYIGGIYNNSENSLTQVLEGINTEQISEYDSLAQSVISKVVSYLSGAQGVSGDDETATSQIEGFISQLDQIDTTAVQPGFDYLAQFHLGYKVKSTPDDVSVEIKQTSGLLRHLLSSKVNSRDETAKNARIENYTNLANGYVQKGADLENSIVGVSGEKLSKQQEYFKLQGTASSIIDQINSELVPVFVDLEKDDLHLESEHTPSSLTIIFNNLSTRAGVLIKEIDAEIAAEKGIEISEEQLAEFRDAFDQFDKNNDKRLEYYELKGALTFIGENSTDDECKALTAKYSGGETTLGFDDYVKLMLERFSKAETADSTIEAFKALTNDQPIVTEAILLQYFSPEDVEFLKSELPVVDGGYNAADWVATLFQS